MGLFKSLSTTRVFGSNYFKYGRYIVRIDRVKRGENYKHVPNIVIEGTVLASLQSSEPGDRHVFGDEAAQVINITNDFAQQQWANFCAGLFGCQVKDLENPEVKTACGGRDIDDWASNEDPKLGPVQPMRGMVAEVDCRCKMTKEAPGKPSHPVTNMIWKREVTMAEVLPMLTPEQVKKAFPGGVPA